MAERKSILLRLDPAVHDALARWAADELRSTNAQIEYLLRRALADAGRLPGGAGAMRKPGRPRAIPRPASRQALRCPGDHVSALPLSAARSAGAPAVSALPGSCLPRACVFMVQ